MKVKCWHRFYYPIIEGGMVQVFCKDSDGLTSSIGFDSKQLRKLADEIDKEASNE